jgi:putative tRNA adenosine deaminase-associated protein
VLSCRQQYAPPRAGLNPPSRIDLLPLGKYAGGQHGLEAATPADSRIQSMDHHRLSRIGYPRSGSIPPCAQRWACWDDDVTDRTEDVDFVITVYREEDQWRADVLPASVTSDLTGFLDVLSRQPSLSGTIGFVGVGDDAFVAVRVLGNEVSALLSDVLAGAYYDLAREVLEFLEIDVPDEEEVDQILPAGDLSIFADLGLDEMDLGMIAGDIDLYPDDAVVRIAERLGFGPAVERAMDIALP